MTSQTSPADDSSALDPERLAQANINPRTRLATDYLNHFNEVIMLLEMLPDMPEFVQDVLAWRPKSYVEHFAHSHFTERDLAIAAYEAAPPPIKDKIDELAHTMNKVLVATRDALAGGLSPEGAGRLGAQVAAWLKPMVAQAGGVINGEHIHFVEDEDEPDADAPPQAVVDALFEH
jgi:hypothetical protein